MKMKKAKASSEAVCDILFNELQKALAPAPFKSAKKRPSEQELRVATEASLAKFYERARAVTAEHKLGVIARARVAFGVQQRLLAAGYPAPMVKQVLFAMLVSVFVRSKK
jgi:hypothetical protein